MLSGQQHHAHDRIARLARPREMFHLRAEPVSAEPKRTADADEALERFRMTGHGAGSEHARQRVPHQGLAIAVHLVVAFDPWLEHILDEAKDRKSTRLNSSH